MKQLPVQTAEEALRAQVTVVSQATGDGVPLPWVRVICGPHVFRGVPVRIEEKRAEPWLVLVDRDSVAYVPLRQVMAVVVENVQSAPVAEPPSRLALERTRKEIESAAQKAWPKGSIAVEWPAEPSEDDRRSIEAALTELQKILTAITADKLGRESLADIHRIFLVPAPSRELRVNRQDSTLTITVGMAADVGSLRQLVEQQL